MEQRVIKISGACTCSRGFMGTGGIILEKEGGRYLHIFSKAKGEGTILKAAYLAVIEALQAAGSLSTVPETLILQSDSHFLLCELNRKEEADPELQQLKEEIAGFISALGYGVEFVWIPYEKNLEAIALAHHSIGMPVAMVLGNEVIEWRYPSDYSKNEMLACRLPELNADTAGQINSLNQSKGICPTRIFSLLTNGVDKYSRARTEELLDFIEIRFGPGTRDYMVQALSGCDLNYTRSVLRWVARGLVPGLAFIKACLEMQIKDIN